MDISKLTYDRVKKAYDEKGYRFREGVYALNVGGIRAEKLVPDQFCCALFGAYTAETGENILFAFRGTTVPGVYWLKNPMNKGGTFVMCPGQYLGSHTKGLHMGKIPAFVQIGNLKGWMDNDRDNIVDFEGTIWDRPGAGVNIHPMGDVLKSIYNWSAGCQGGKTEDINALLFLYDKQVEWQKIKTIDYTLFEEKDMA